MSNTTETEHAKATISPKVIATAVTTVLLTAVLGGINALTPELFSFLGPWKGVAFAFVVAIGGPLASYLKSDPLRYAPGETYEE